LIPLGIMILGTYMVYYFYWREIADVMAPVGDGKK
jgi:hypothetical protein